MTYDIAEVDTLFKRLVAAKVSESIAKSNQVLAELYDLVLHVARQQEAESHKEERL